MVAARSTQYLAFGTGYFFVKKAKAITLQIIHNTLEMGWVVVLWDGWWSCGMGGGLVVVQWD
jgi:hypothetical protein